MRSGLSCRADRLRAVGSQWLIKGENSQRRSNPTSQKSEALLTEPLSSPAAGRVDGCRKDARLRQVTAITAQRIMRKVPGITQAKVISISYLTRRP
jgi:hypothetical protein